MLTNSNKTTIDDQPQDCHNLLVMSIQEIRTKPQKSKLRLIKVLVVN